jgi:hypothetical protein
VDIKRSFLVQLVAEEVQKALQEFSHGDNEPKKKKGKRPETKDASDEPSKDAKAPKAKDEPPQGPKSSPPVGDDPAAEEPVEDPVAKGDGTYDDEEGLPGDDEMAADDVDADADEQDALDADGDAGEDGAEGEINDQISGRTVQSLQSLSLEPESELLPGSREVVFTFSDSPDVLRVLVDDVGNIVFSWNGKLTDYP